MVGVCLVGHVLLCWLARVNSTVQWRVVRASFRGLGSLSPPSSLPPHASRPPDLREYIHDHVVKPAVL